MHNRTAVVALVLAAAFALPAVAQQRVHRWVDEAGRVHYGDRPLATSGTTMRIRAESATAPGGAAQGPAAGTPAARPPSAAATQAARPPSAAASPRSGKPAPDLDRLLARRAACARTPNAPGC